MNRLLKNSRQWFILTILASLLLILVACGDSSNTQNNGKTNYNSSSSYSSSSSSTSSYSSSSSQSSFTNKYGTASTKCAHPGCNNYIASSGDTNCCTLHSNKCKECGKYIDEDATWCMDCLTSAANSKTETSSKTPSTSSTKGPWHSSNVKSDGMGPYNCYGKNDTCNNKTYNYQDLYCDTCDPDGDNVENK